MSTAKISSIKIPPFDKANFGLWTRHMLLFLRAANKKYINILTKGLSPPMNIILEHTEDGVTIPHRTYLKTPTEFSDEDNELINLDVTLQLILIESLDPIMYNNVVNCCLLYTSPSPRDQRGSRMPSSA